jgi:hypothetical protein
MKEIRTEMLGHVLERLDRLQKIGVIEPDGDILIDVEEASAIACLDKNTILTWGQNGKIARYKIGGAVRFGLREFCAWIAGCRQPALSEKRKDKGTA